jgi:hypothetical protein
MTAQEDMDLERELQTLRTYFDNAEAEIKSLKAGRRAAAPRARKSLQQIKQTSHKIRGDIMNTVKSMPVKSRTKKEVAEPVEEVLPLPPVLKREESEAPVKPKPVRKPRAKKQTKK